MALKRGCRYAPHRCCLLDRAVRTRHGGCPTTGAARWHEDSRYSCRRQRTVSDRDRSRTDGRHSRSPFRATRHGTCYARDSRFSRSERRSARTRRERNGTRVPCWSRRRCRDWRRSDRFGVAWGRGASRCRGRRIGRSAGRGGGRKRRSDGALGCRSRVGPGGFGLEGRGWVQGGDSVLGFRLAGGK